MAAFAADKDLLQVSSLVDGQRETQVARISYIVDIVEVAGLKWFHATVPPCLFTALLRSLPVHTLRPPLVTVVHFLDHQCFKVVALATVTVDLTIAPGHFFEEWARQPLQLVTIWDWGLVEVKGRNSQGSRLIGMLQSVCLPKSRLDASDVLHKPNYLCSVPECCIIPRWLTVSLFYAITGMGASPLQRHWSINFPFGYFSYVVYKNNLYKSFWIIPCHTADTLGLLDTIKKYSGEFQDIALLIEVTECFGPNSEPAATADWYCMNVCGPFR